MLKQKNASAAAGSDGLPLIFYNTFFKETHVHLLSMLNRILADGIRPETCRESRVILLLKSGGEA